MRPATFLVLAILLGCQQGAGLLAPDSGGPPADDAAADDGRPLGADLPGAADQAPGGLTPGTTTIALTVGVVERTAVLHVPASPGRLPLVVALHGNGDTAQNFVRAIGLVALAEATPFVLAAPQGIAQTITIGTQTVRVSWDAYRGPGANIDLALLRALREQLVRSGSIDGDRVLLLGYSQGGYLAFREGMDSARELSCAAVVAAANPMPGSRLVPDAPRRIPVALQIGSLDGAVGGARAARDELLRHGHPVRYEEIGGAGHAPFPGDVKVPLAYCLEQRR